MDRQADNIQKYDIVVVGGGLAGLSAALASARLGCKVALVEERPVLGGNSSSFIRIGICGANRDNPWARETGIIEELFTEDRAKNHGIAENGHINSIWDLLLYTKAKEEENLNLFLNTSAYDVKVVDSKFIEAITCLQLGTGFTLILKADLFIDASGDGDIAYKAGARFRMGREAKSEFEESWAPPKGDSYTQGSSLLFHAKNVGYPIQFNSLPGAKSYPADEDFPFRKHKNIEAGYPWIEIGNPPFNTIADNERIRDELLNNLLGIWDHIKNYGNHGADNYALDWIGAIPGKRESRRFIGDYILTQKDVQETTLFTDSVAYGGWVIDIHTLGGLLAKGKPETLVFTNLQRWADRLVPPYSIPLRCLYSKNINNLMMAGRDISVTHIAHGSTRVMATCAVIGQAVGMAGSLCKKYGISPRKVYQDYIQELQQLLLKQDCYIPNIKNEDEQDLMRNAQITASSSALLKFEKGEIREECESIKVWSASSLETEKAQLFPVSSNYIDYIEVLIESHFSAVTEVQLVLREAKTIWDLKNESNLATSKARVHPKTISWVKFRINRAVSSNKLYWIFIRSQKEIFWRYSKKAPVGTVSACRLFGIWKLQKGAYSMRLFPPSSPYQAENVLSGVARPEKYTNIWISNPEEEFPQYLEIDFGKPKKFNTVYLTFDTDLNKTYGSIPPLYRSPSCVKDYGLYYLYQMGRWELLVNIKKNYQRHRTHRFPVVTAQKLKLVIQKTNGLESAHIYEIRVYQEKGLSG